jgi:hypothetical protein
MNNTSYTIGVAISCPLARTKVRDPSFWLYSRTSWKRYSRKSEVPQLTLFPDAYTFSSEGNILQSLRDTKTRRVRAWDRYLPSS